MGVQALGLPWGRPGFSRTESNKRALPLASKSGTPVRSDVFVRFGQTQPRFIAPMVVEGLPAFNAQDPQALKTMHQLLETAKSFARPNVSGRQVGAVAIGKSGRAYLGTNIEIKGDSPANTLHAEAFTLTLARLNGETGLEHLFVSLEPCGPCRQVLAETGQKDLPIHILKENGTALATNTLDQLLPGSYTYAHPGMNMFKPPAFSPPARYRPHSEMARQALAAARQVYQPNPRKDWGAIAVRLNDGRVLRGASTTISGPNPTITPIQNILIQLVSQQTSFDAITEATLLEPENADYSSYNQTRAILKRIAPQARLRRVQLPNA